MNSFLTFSENKRPEFSGDLFNTYFYIMAEDLILKGESKEERYMELTIQLTALLSGETDSVAKMANLCAGLKFGMDFFWVGFYLVKNDELVLGPFQGPVACMRIQKGKGVCGTSWEKGEAILVPDVELFPGHIACSSFSKSEVVIPFRNRAGDIVGVLDVDSDKLATFDESDVEHLTKILNLLK
jgi:GAF domain-containing protein